MHRKLPSYAAFALILAGAGGGCSGLSLPAIESIGSGEATPGETKAEAAPKSDTQPLMISASAVGSPTEVYTRLARGVLTCWFGADGPLKKSYIYHAQADPASKGGNSRIRIMTRDHEADDPRALRAYMVQISPGDGRTKVEVENRRLPAHLADALKKDIERWATGEDGCGEAPVTAGWSPDPAQTDNNRQKNKGN